MKNTTKGFLAGAAGLGLILGGSTFALWSDTADINGTTLTAGNLDVKVLDPEWKDISRDRTDGRRGGHDIDNIEDFRIIPGDKIQAKYGVSVGLEGENMVAQLRLKDKDGKPVGDDLARGLKINYQIEKAGGGGFWPLGEEDLTGGSEGVEMNLLSHEAETAFSKDNGNLPPWWARAVVVDRDVDNKADFYVTVTIEFEDKGKSQGQDLVKAQTSLAGSQLELKQVRDDVHGYR